MPQGGDNDGSEEEHETEQVQLVSGYRSKRRKTERADTPNTLLTAQADEQDDLGTAEIREVESPFTTYHLDMADLEASGSEPVGDLGFREGYPEIAAYHHAFPIVEKRVTGVCDFLITCIEQLRALGWYVHWRKLGIGQWLRLRWSVRDMRCTWRCSPRSIPQSETLSRLSRV